MKESGNHLRQSVSIYDLRDPTRAQRFFLTAGIAACVGVAWWLLFGEVISGIATRITSAAPAADPIRRLLLALALTIYFIRLLFTQFVFLRRAIRWGEAITITIWVAFIYLLLSLTARANTHPAGLVTTTGIALFLLGSWMNSWSEYQRHRWKQRPENHGRLYTAGLFRFCRHPNYFGDLIAFSGLALIAGRWITGIIPAIILVGFVFVNIPMLDAHLADRYGEEFITWARRTRKLIPFVY